MPNLAALFETPTPRLQAGEVDPFGQTVEFAPILVLEDTGAADKDGIPIPPLWQHSRERWEQLPLNTRRRKAEEDQKMRSLRKEKTAQPPRTGATRFTTDYAIAYGRQQGWTLVDRERFDARTKHHHDLQLGVDAMFDDGDGLIGIQGAGKSERKEHWDRFVERGGVETASRRHIRILYVEFERGNKTPIKLEWWAGGPDEVAA